MYADVHRRVDMRKKEVDVFIANIRLAKLFEEAYKIYPKPQEISNWLLGAFLEQVSNLEDKFDSVKISAKNFSKVVKYFSEGKMNNLAAKKALFFSIATDEDIDKIIEREKLVQVSGEGELNTFIEEAVKENAKAVKEYSEGKQQAIMFLVGQVMKKTKGKANPKVAREMLERRLKK